MALAVDAAPISISITREGPRPSIRLAGRADHSNISRIVDILDRLADEEERCVSLDLNEVESMDTTAIERLAGTVGVYKDRKKRLHLRAASEPVRDMFDRHVMSDAFCVREDCLHECCPHTCGIASAAWAIDVFCFPSLMANCHEARERVDRVAEAVGFSKCRRSDIMLAVGEAVTNAVKYGHNGDKAHFTVSCVATTEKLSVSVSDNGPGFSLQDIPTFEDALMMESGRGVHCINAVMDEVDFQFDDGTTVRMVKHS
ncbi:MAG: ATP-binding protein [Armatimonadetes bacterium]|nr:ATP-binding protein [Armatimonadota bacterium]